MGARQIAPAHCGITAAHVPPSRRKDMNTTVSLTRSLIIVASAALFAACADEAPVAPTQQPAVRMQVSGPSQKEIDARIAQIRRVTDRYHEIDVAIKEGFVKLHDCEVRPNEGPVGTVYVHVDRLMDGVINPAKPDALIYEPTTTGGLKLVGVEFAVPYALWKSKELPRFLGVTFQREDEFQVYALHLWT